MKPTAGSTLLSFAALISSTLSAVTLSIARNPNAQQQISRRYLSGRSAITESLGNNVTGGSYIANVTVGTPPQQIQLILDTGSSDVFALDNTADLCTNVTEQAELGSGCQTPCKLSNPYLPLQSQDCY